MPFNPNAAEVYADGPSSVPSQPSKPEVRALLTSYEQILDAFITDGGLIYATRALLYADLSPPANRQAWVISDATTAYNGIYQKVGAAGVGSWIRVLDLPFSFIVAIDAGAGTPNAIQATSTVPISSSALVVLSVFEANDSSPVSVSFNGASDVTIKTNTGNDIVPGGLTAGMQLFGYKSGSTYRLISDQVSSAIVAAAEAQAIRAETARDVALGAVPNVFSPTRTALKALDTSTKTSAYLTEVGREGQFIWRTGDYSAQITLDSHEGIYLKANAIAATAGAWVRMFFGAANVEWWGAKVNDTSDLTGNTAAIQAAIDNYGDILLGFGTYHTNDTLRIRTSLRTIQGINYNNTTKISIHSATKDCLFVGPDTYTPGDSSTFIFDIRLSQFAMYRAIAATTPVTADKDGACGLRQAGVIRCLTDHVFTYDDYIGFYLIDTANADFSNCSAVTARTSGTYFGWYVDGITTSNEAHMSSNASARYADCIVLAASVDTAIGWEIIGRFSDQFLLRPETALLHYGIRIRGMTDYGGADSRQNIDVQIVDPVFDGIKSCGLFVRGTNPYGAISVIGGYGAVYGGVTASIVSLNDAQGTIISGFQFIGFPSSASQGLLISTGKGNIVTDCIWQDFDRPIVLSNTNLNRISGEVTNISQATGKIAVSVGTSARNKIDVSVFGNGASTQFAIGVDVDSASGFNEINCTGIDPGTVVAKVKVNGTAITTAGLTTGGNLITGVMA